MEAVATPSAPVSIRVISDPSNTEARGTSLRLIRALSPSPEPSSALDP
jgi:hypothetical protein